MDTPSWQAFRPEVSGIFRDRPNRFVARVEVDGQVVEAHCPNPGRLAELLLPGTSVVLERAPGRKLPYTLVAVERPGSLESPIIPLASVRANAAVQALVLPRLFPGATVKPEVPQGSSRFDFLVEDAEGRHLVEVKACSEVEAGSALFPDAPSLRAHKHLEELAAWTDRGYRAHVIFAVVHGRPGWWAPNVHTDPEFARILAREAHRLCLHAVVMQTRRDGSTTLVEPSLAIDLPDPGPDAGHLIRVVAHEAGWSLQVEFHSEGFEKAVSRAPARSSFAVRGLPDQREFWQQALAPLERPTDPRGDQRFFDAIMDARHRRFRPGQEDPSRKGLLSGYHG